MLSAKVSNVVRGINLIVPEPSTISKFLCFQTGYGKSSQSFGLKKFGLKTIAKQKANANIPTIKYISAMEFAECLLRVLFQILVVGYVRICHLCYKSVVWKKNIPEYVTNAPTKEGKHVNTLPEILKTNNVRIAMTRESTSCRTLGLVCEAKWK